MFCLASRVLCVLLSHPILEHYFIMISITQFYEFCGFSCLWWHSMIVWTARKPGGLLQPRLSLSSSPPPLSPIECASHRPQKSLWGTVPGIQSEFDSDICCYNSRLCETSMSIFIESLLILLSIQRAKANRSFVEFETSPEYIVPSHPGLQSETK